MSNFGEGRSEPSLVESPQTGQVPSLLEPSLPFVDEDFFKDRIELRPAEPQLKTSSLPEVLVELPGNIFFKDRVLPPSQHVQSPNLHYSAEYFVELSKLASSPGHSWPADTPNYLGSRIQLAHSKLNIPSWRRHLVGYDEPEISWFLQFGFPIGLQEDPAPVLVSSQANHGSSYQYYSSIDKFIKVGLVKCDLVGPFEISPFEQIQVSPLMTAPKKPCSRRPVFDASYGDHSLNSNTPADFYLGQPMEYAYPRIEDFKNLILQKGQACFIWKGTYQDFSYKYPFVQLTTQK